jgi:hypothetical protein
VGRTSFRSNATGVSERVAIVLIAVLTVAPAPASAASRSRKSLTEAAWVRQTLGHMTLAE